MTTVTAPVHSPSASSALYSSDLLDLVSRSREALTEACAVTTTSQRYVAAHLAALRAAAGLLAHTAPRGLSAKPRSAWDAVAQHAPELGEWAVFFAGCARRSRAVAAGIATVSAREADDLVRQAESFLSAVLFHVGLPPVPVVSTHLAPTGVR